MNTPIPFAFIGGIGVPEIIAILVVGLLLFGKRLPEVGRNAGKTFMEFKRGVRGIKDQFYDLDSMADREAEEQDMGYDQVIGQIDPAADDIVVEADEHDHDEDPHDGHIHDSADKSESDAGAADDTPRD